MSSSSPKKDFADRGVLFGDITRIVEDLGYECVHVGEATESGRQIIRIFIDSLGGINVKDCEGVSKAVNRYLDGRDDSALGERYYLEVSSPGLERPLFKPKDYDRFKGKEVRVKTNGLIDQRKIHVGLIETSDELCVTLNTDQGKRIIPFEQISRASLVFRGLDAQEPQKRQEHKRKGKRYEEEL